MLYQIEELQRLVSKAAASEDLLRRAYEFYDQHFEEWHADFRAHFADYLERKQEQIYYEWHLVDKIGLMIALDRKIELDI